MCDFITKCRVYVANELCAAFDDTFMKLCYIIIALDMESRAK